MTTKIGDRVSFDTDEGIQIGYVNALRRDVGNGELNAWIELDHPWPGLFRAVPVSALLSSEVLGPPSTMHFENDSVEAVKEFRRWHLGNFGTVMTQEHRDTPDAADDKKSGISASRPVAHLQKWRLPNVV
ncbi:hypothetical protein [Glaciimonas sp. PCH181]|uniref:hypothetical protein n=1 Tax=Glaciimonas sp. PCH181 TaxID=2133943 RepID=UPI000D3395FD|nr:hypothetical protein [Glaciimonas sp. PCH181]PUA16851.1 hypothetical protein C7W93_22990 [Glaciimonas sp. PCH181]